MNREKEINLNVVFSFLITIIIYEMKELFSPILIVWFRVFLESHVYDLCSMGKIYKFLTKPFLPFPKMIFNCAH